MFRTKQHLKILKILNIHLHCKQLHVCRCHESASFGVWGEVNRLQILLSLPVLRDYFERPFVTVRPMRMADSRTVGDPCPAQPIQPTATTKWRQICQQISLL